MLWLEQHAAAVNRSSSVNGAVCFVRSHYHFISWRSYHILFCFVFWHCAESSDSVCCLCHYKTFLRLTSIFIIVWFGLHSERQADRQNCTTTPVDWQLAAINWCRSNRTRAIVSAGRPIMLSTYADGERQTTTTNEKAWHSSIDQRPTDDAVVAQLSTAAAESCCSCPAG